MMYYNDIEYEPSLMCYFSNLFFNLKRQCLLLLPFLYLCYEWPLNCKLKNDSFKPNVAIQLQSYRFPLLFCMWLLDAGFNISCRFHIHVRILIRVKGGEVTLLETEKESTPFNHVLLP